MEFDLTVREIVYIEIWCEDSIKEHLNYARINADNLKRKKKGTFIYNLYKKNIRDNLDHVIMCKNILRKLK